MSLKIKDTPTNLLVEQHGLENQIKRLTDLNESESITYIKERLKNIIPDLIDIKECIKGHNNKKVDEISSALIKNYDSLIERTNDS